MEVLNIIKPTFHKKYLYAKSVKKMIFSFKFIALLGTTCFSVVTAQQTGENCPVYTSVECYLGSPPSNGMPDGEACYKLKEEATCGIKQVYWKYKYWNSNSEGKTMKMWLIKPK